MGERGAGRVVVVEAAEQLAALASGATQDRVDEAGATAAAAPPLRERDGLIDGRVIGFAAAVEQLVEAEAERRPQRRVDPLGGTVGEPGDEVVGRPAALHGPVGERLRLRALTPLEPEPAGRGAERAIRPGVLLEDAPDGLERGSACGGRRAHRGGGATGGGGPWPRR